MNKPEPFTEVLTKRELEILALLVENKTNQEIADQLHLALSSIKWYAGEIYGKLGVENRRQAVKKASELGLLAKPVQPTQAEALPLTPAGIFPNNLPEELTSFIGREEEIELLAKQLREGKTRLLTLTGSGGTGKTRLSLKVAEKVLDRFPAGVWLVELATLSDPELVVSTVAQVLGVREVPGTPMIDTLCSYLKNKRALLILDNCEHLLSACATLTEKLLRSGPEVRLLVSSREILNVPGETPFRVPSLAVPKAKPLLSIGELARSEAVRLFVERAAQVSADFSLNGSNAQTIVTICRRLDGIPLAIELAASRARVMPVTQIAARLDNLFRLLIGGARTVMPRQQTLKATIDWSYNLLNQKEKTALQRLSVFCGGWTLEAAEKVIPDSPIKADCEQDGIHPEEMLDVLASLVDKSLVILSGSEGREAGSSSEPRYRMLETIRQYAREKLSNEELALVRLLDAGIASCIEAVRDRHLAYYLSLSEEAERNFRPKDQIRWLNQIEIELDNIRLALEWSLGTASSADVHLVEGMRLASALKWFWHIRYRSDEGNIWLERLLRLEAQSRGATLLAAGIQSDMYILAWVRCVNALSFGLSNYSWTIIRDQIPEMLLKAIDLCRAIGAAANRDLVWSLLYRYREISLPDGESFLEEALRIARENHFRFEEADALYHHWLNCFYKNQEYDKGAQSLKKSLAIVKELQDVDGMADRTLASTFLAAINGDLRLVKNLYDEAIPYYWLVNNFRSIHMWEIAILRFFQDPLLIEQAQRAVQYFEEMLDLSNVLFGYAYLIQAEWSNGNTEEAERLSDQALSLRAAANKPSFVNFIYLSLYASGLATASKNLPKALHHLRTAGLLIPKYLPVNLESRIMFLDILSNYAVRSGTIHRDVRILGASDSTFRALRNLMFPWEIKLREETVQSARLALGEEAFRAAWEADQAMTFVQAFDSFLEEFLRTHEQQASSE